MIVKQQLIAEINNIDNSAVLIQLFEFMKLVKQNTIHNKNVSLLQFAGCLDDAQAKAMRDVITSEFNHIEGEW